MTHLLHNGRSRILPRLAASLLLLLFLISFARIPLARGYEVSPGRQNFTAVILDGDASNRHELAGSVDKAPHLAPDGYLFALPPDLLRPKTGVPAPCTAEIPFVLPMHFLYTQLTSSAL